MTKDTIREPARRTPVTGSFDVVVVGGGIAGVAAAIAAARNGASVCLVEKTCSLGGLATLGVVTVWLPLCDGRGRQVIAGLPEELLKLSVADLGRDAPRARLRGIPPCWRPGGDVRERTRRRYSAEFNPTAYLLALEKCAVDSGASLRYDTWVCGVRREAGAIRHLITESKDGRAALACRTVVDATGDADVCFLAGEQTESLDTNVLSGWYYHIEDGELVLNQLSNRFSERGDRQGAEGPFFRGDRAADVTAQVLGSRELIRRCLAARRAERPDVDIQPILLPTIPCFRMTRRLVGAMSLGEQHVHQWFDDCIGLTGD